MLLHVPDDVLCCGPVWVSWSFSIKQYRHEIIGCAKSKVVPYSTINKHILMMAQLAAVASRFPEIRKALLFGKADAPVKTSQIERIYPECKFELCPVFLILSMPSRSRHNSLIPLPSWISLSHHMSVFASPATFVQICLGVRFTSGSNSFQSAVSAGERFGLLMAATAFDAQPLWIPCHHMASEIVHLFG